MSTPITGADGSVRARVAALLAGEQDRGALLRQLDALASGDDAGDFDACADLWAPALYARDPGFFEHYLLRYLHDDHEEVIRALLPRAEAAGQDALFSGLYAKIAEEGEWNAEALALARSAAADDAVLRALDLRDAGARNFTLGEEPAMALYQRNAARFAPFILAHAERHWNSDDHGFTQLRAEAQRRGDAATYWALFREWAEPSEWASELRALLKHPVPASEILGALRQRQPRETDELDAGIFADFIEHYGAAVVPYIEENLDWIDRRQAARLLPAIRRVGDEALYWRIFFQAGNAKQWNESLRELLDARMADAELTRALRLRTPPLAAHRSWQLDPALALRMYERDALQFRPFLERTLADATPQLFAAAERANDEDFLDFLTAGFLLRMHWWVARGYPTPAQAQWQKPDMKSREQVAAIGGMLTGRFDRLYAELPAKYVLHAASTLSRFDVTSAGLGTRDIEHNPAVAYLVGQHREDWCRSAHAIRELLESPSVRVQSLGMGLLSVGGADAAERVRENLLPLRALLLGQTSRVVKRQALACLEQTGRQSTALAGKVLPLLEDALYFRGKHAIDEAIMVGAVRLKAFWAAQQTAAQPA